MGFLKNHKTGGSRFSCKKLGGGGVGGLAVHIEGIAYRRGEGVSMAFHK